ncbi:MAG: hypothetical protein ACI915_002643 [Gammaproteobacteria bacterium]|jgi:hypothetical protein
MPNARFVSTARLLPSWIAAFSGHAELQVERIVIGRDELQNVVVPIQFGSRKFSVRGAQGAVGSGHVELDWNHDIANAQNSLTLVGRDLRTADIATLQALIDAPVNFHIELDGLGRSLHEFFSTAGGYVKADLGAGSFAGNYLAQAGSDLLSYMVAGLNPFASRSEETPFRCARARFEVHRGEVAEMQLFGLQTEQFTVLCNGKMNFGTEQVGLVCRPHQHKGLVPDGLSVVQSVEIFGTFSKPEIKLNKLGVLKRGASLGVGLTGFGISRIGDLLAQTRRSTAKPCLIQGDGSR